MPFNRFKQQKKPNYKRFIILVLILLLVILLWKNAEAILEGLFTPSP
jgi:predicted negative regulator of RcsB-dependent stress response